MTILGGACHPRRTVSRTDFRAVDTTKSAPPVWPGRMLWISLLSKVNSLSSNCAAAGNSDRASTPASLLYQRSLRVHLGIQVAHLAIVVARGRANVDLPRTCNLLLLVQQHLLPLRQPAGSTRNREQHGEEVRGERHGAINQPRVKVHVRIQLAFLEVIVRQRNPLQLERNLQVAVHAHLLEHLVCKLLHDARTRIVALVHPVTEAHQALTLAALHAVNERSNVLLVADLLDHPQHCLVRAAVKWPE